MILIVLIVYWPLANRKKEDSIIGKFNDKLMRLLTKYRFFCNYFRTKHLLAANDVSVMVLTSSGDLYFTPNNLHSHYSYCQQMSRLVLPKIMPYIQISLIRYRPLFFLFKPINSIKIQLFRNIRFYFCKSNYSK